MAVNWPSGLRGPLQDGWDRTEPDGVEVTQMQDGPPKRRRTSAAARAKEVLQFKWSVADYATFKSFYATNKAQAINYTHPLWGAVTMYFDGPPRVKAQSIWRLVTVPVEVDP